MEWNGMQMPPCSAAAARRPSPAPPQPPPLPAPPPPPPQEARNIEEFRRNFASDPTVKIPWVRRDLCSSQVIVMEWIDGIRCTDVPGIMSSGVDVDNFIK
jgi:hypothetical protein